MSIASVRLSRALERESMPRLRARSRAELVRALLNARASPSDAAGLLPTALW